MGAVGVRPLAFSDRRLVSYSDQQGLEGTGIIQKPNLFPQAVTIGNQVRRQASATPTSLPNPGSNSQECIKEVLQDLSLSAFYAKVGHYGGQASASRVPTSLPCPTPLSIHGPFRPKIHLSPKGIFQQLGNIVTNLTQANPCIVHWGRMTRRRAKQIGIAHDREGAIRIQSPGKIGRHNVHIHTSIISQKRA